MPASKKTTTATPKTTTAKKTPAKKTSTVNKALAKELYTKETEADRIISQFKKAGLRIEKTENGYTLDLYGESTRDFPTPEEAEFWLARYLPFKAVIPDFVRVNLLLQMTDDDYFVETVEGVERFVTLDLAKTWLNELLQETEEEVEPELEIEIVEENQSSISEGLSPEIMPPQTEVKTTQVVFTDTAESETITQLSLFAMTEQEKASIKEVGEKEATAVKASFLSNLGTGTLAEMYKDNILLSGSTTDDLSGTYTLDKVVALLSCSTDTRSIAIAAAKRGFMLFFDGKTGYTLSK